jgi:hypothetical protein
MTTPQDSLQVRALPDWMYAWGSAAAIALFALWWGGITFYALVVVPIGTDLIGSTEQGFITQRVTWWHNCLAVAMSGYVVLVAWRRRQVKCWVLAMALVVITGALWVVHGELSGLLDVEQRSVPTSFYARHAIYLWLTTAEWLIGLVVGWALLPVQWRATT